MSGPQFHETGYGRRFLNDQLPHLIETLGAIAHELKRINDREDSHEPVRDPEWDTYSEFAQAARETMDAVEEIAAPSTDPVVLRKGAPILERNGFWLGQSVQIINQKSRTGHDVHAGVITYLGIDDVQVVVRANEHEHRVGMIKVSYSDLKKDY